MKIGLFEKRLGLQGRTFGTFDGLAELMRNLEAIAVPFLEKAFSAVVRQNFDIGLLE